MQTRAEGRGSRDVEGKTGRVKAVRSKVSSSFGIDRALIIF